MLQENRLFEITFIKVIVGFNVCMQVLGVLRAATIFNTVYIANALRLLFVSVFGIWFLFQYKKRKKEMDIWDWIFLFIPLFATTWGIYFCGLSRYTFSDLFNALGFWMIFYTYKNQENIWDKKLLIWIANVEVIGVIISYVLYAIFPLFGFSIFSVSKVSNFLLLPLAIYLAYGSKCSVLVLGLILYGGKRGVMLAAICMLFFFFLASPKIERKIKVVAIGVVVLVGGVLCWLTYSPENFQFLGYEGRRVLNRIMLINPLSPYRDYFSDGRLDEVISALQSMRDNPLKVIIGNGSGFTYDYYFHGELFSAAHHNVHVSPVDLLTKYGVIYAIAMYANAMLVLGKGTKALYLKYNKEIFVMLLYVCGTLVDSLTTCLIFLDYQYIIILGTLNGVLITKQKQR